MGVAGKLETFTDANWPGEVLQSPHPVLVDFWAEWCVPCKALVPVMEAVAAHFDGRLKVGKLNVDENGMVAEQYAVRTLPTLLVLKKGQVSEQRIGLISKDALIKLIEPHL
ncbi:MAG TPA: thioredoxin [Vicinamibacteria bacterium]|nr:thioredoxin [Vicinamibacteria bacterium]